MHGIGGRTIAEAKRNLTWVEAQRWFRYIADNGTLDLGQRIEHGFALLAWLITQQGHNGKPMKKSDGSPFTTADFMPHAKKKTVESIDDKLLGWAQNFGKKK